VLGQIRDSLQPQPITITTLPPELVRTWWAPDGRARVSVTPKGDANNDQVLSRFIAACIKVVPEATGTSLSIQEAGRAVVGAFAEAGALAFAAITGLLLITLAPWQAPQIRLRLPGGLELCTLQRKAPGVDVRLA
jgi:hypothetical protein